MEMDKEPIDKLLADYKKPEDIVGENGLTLHALHVLDDLPHRRLSNIQVRAPLQMMQLHFHGFTHSVAPRCSALMAMTAKT
jgi:hypothetical protein